LNIDKLIYFDDNKEDAINGLLKLGDKLYMKKDSNSVIYVVFSQLNPKRWGGYTLIHTYDLYFLLCDKRLQAYVELIRDCDYVN
jgi:hypothetical protein